MPSLAHKNGVDTLGKRPHDRCMMRPCADEAMRLRRGSPRVTVNTGPMDATLRLLGPQAREAVSRLPQAVNKEASHGKR